jgi:hypothetical protein
VVTGLLRGGCGLLPPEDADSSAGFADRLTRSGEESGRHELDNTASTRTIDRRGGVLEDVRPAQSGMARRYRIEPT